MTTATRILAVALTSVCLLWTLTLTPVLADPLPGRDVLKFQQLPMIATPIEGAIYFGHDELSTIEGDHASGQYGSATGIFAPGIFMADDFSDTKDTPVVHVRFWGSYMNGNDGGATGGVSKFLISFEEDRVAGSDGLPFSHPGTPLLTQVVDLGPLAPGSGTFTETLISPGGPPLSEALYEYNAELKVPFNQMADTIYWLKITALVDTPVDAEPGTRIEWGWHNRNWTVTDPFASPVPVPGEYIQGVTPGGTPIWHFQDDSVQGEIDNVDLFAPVPPVPPGGIAMDQLLVSFLPQNYVDDIDGPFGISNFSKDLAFELFTIPEPSSLTLAGFGLIGLLHYLRRRPRRT